MASEVGNDELLDQQGIDLPDPESAEAIEPDSEPSRPDITPAQIIGLVPIVAALLRAFGVYDLNPEQQAALQDAVTAGLALFGADAIIRFGRNLAQR